MEAEQLAVNLRGNGVRLAVLSGCETGRHDGAHVWDGIAPALVKAEIPAARQGASIKGVEINIYSHFQAAPANLRRSFDTLIQDKLRGFVGRRFVLEAIDDFLNRHESGYLIIRGVPGIGKHTYPLRSGCGETSAANGTYNVFIW